MQLFCEVILLFCEKDFFGFEILLRPKILTPTGRKNNRPDLTSKTVGVIIIRPVKREGLAFMYINKLTEDSLPRENC